MSSEQDPKLKEIFDILLSAGYFRCRIPSISTFDKLLGGLAWCITLANFDIDIEFSDDMNMGQKIKLSEKVVNCLQKMGCPHEIKPHQIQGLDLKNIFPIVQWLINFVLETKDLRQDFNRSVSIYHGNNFYHQRISSDGLDEIIKKQNLKDRRIAKNSKVENYSFRDPLRVYSTLIEYDDKTAIRTYNRLSTYLAAEDKKKKKEKEVESTYKTIQLGKGNKKDKEEQESALESSLFIPDTSNSESVNPDALEFIEIRRERRGSVSGQNLYNIVVQNRQNIVRSMQQHQEEDEEDMANVLKLENEFFEEQKIGMKKQVEKLQEKENIRQEQLKKIEDSIQAVEKKYNEIKTLNSELTETAEIIQKKINALKGKVTSQKIAALENLIKKKNELKTEKSNLKKNVKTEMKKVEEEKQEIEEAWPIYSEPISDDIIKEYEMKKEKYDYRYKEFAKLNQEIAVLQRKIEGYPSSIETAQYYKRFLELYDRINFEMEMFRDNFIRYNNSQDIKACMEQEVDIMRSFKEGVLNTGKSKSKREEFLRNLQEAYKGLQENLKRSGDALAKVKLTRDKNSEAYNQLLNQERQYFGLLRELQIEYQKNEKLIEFLAGQDN